MSDYWDAVEADEKSWSILSGNDEETELDS